ncbi:hypothetical protein Bca101_037712 [Brassica carinata]
METLLLTERLLSHNYQNTYYLSPYRSRLTNTKIQESYQHANYRPEMQNTGLIQPPLRQDKLERPTIAVRPEGRSHRDSS